MKHQVSQVIFVSAIAAIVGIAAGILGAVASENYLSQYVASLQEAGERGLTLSEQKPRPIPGTFEEALESAKKNVLPAVVQFYRGSADAVVLPGTAIGAGVVVTSDGWVATTKDVVAGGALTNLRAEIQSGFYRASEIFSDPLTDVVMVKLVDAQGLPVIPFGASDQVEGGDLAFVAISGTAILPTAIFDAEHLNITVAANPSEMFLSEFALADQIVTPGAPVVNTAGELIAFTLPRTAGEAGGVAALPLHHSLSAIRSVIRSGELTRVILGTTTIDLAAVQEPTTISRGFNHGAYVTAVATGSPAALSGVLRGDIITKVDNQLLNAADALAETFVKYNPGDRVALTVDRDGTEVQIEVELGGR